MYVCRLGDTELRVNLFYTEDDGNLDLNLPKKLQFPRRDNASTLVF